MTRKDTTTRLQRAEIPRQAQKSVPPRALKLGGVSLLCCAAALLAGCSNDPMQPQGALWTGATKARADTASPGTVSSKAAYSAVGATRGAGWGPYSGRRGQTSPPTLQTYAFKGDPNANGTFAPGPGQM